MNAIEITKDGLTLIVTDDEAPESGYSVISGGDRRCPTWDEYLDDYAPEYKPHVELIKQAITDLQWIGKCADEVCNDYIFKFSDGSTWGFTWRAWGDLMQAIVNKKEGYMKYYMVD